MRVVIIYNNLTKNLNISFFLRRTILFGEHFLNNVHRFVTAYELCAMASHII